MKLEKKVVKLLSDHELKDIMDHLIAKVSLPKLLLQISNRLCYKANTNDKQKAKVWMKRAKLIHTIMEEIEKEEAGLSL